MSSRNIENPGIQINEIDRSQYDKIDYSLQNAPTVLTYGFASKGEDLALTWINSKQTLDDTYGSPTNEYERYFYNSIYEVLNRGATCIAAKLPYNHESYQKYNYVQFDASNIEYFNTPLSNIVPNQLSTIGDIHDSLSIILNTYKISYNIENIINMISAIDHLYEMSKSLSIDSGDLETIGDMKNALEKFINNSLISSEFAALQFNDSNLTSCLDIKYETSNKDSMEAIDAYLTNSKALKLGKIRIYDITRSQYDALTAYNGCVKTVISSSSGLSGYNYNDCLGIVPVIVTPANALFFQNLLQFGNTSVDVDYSAYNETSGFNTVNFNPRNSTFIVRNFSNIDSHSVIPIASLPDLNTDSTGYNYVSLAQIAASSFPTINFNGPSHYDTTYLKCIGIAVFKAYADFNNDGKLNFELLESFVGSLRKTARDPMTNADMFIDNIVNSRSQYIRLFSNVNQKKEEIVATYAMSRQPAISLGFYKIDCAKKISYEKSLIKPLSQLLANASNKNSMPLDIIVDAGVSNIAQLAYVTNNKIIDADKLPNVADIPWILGQDGVDLSGWKAILSKLDNFVKYDRKDCMFIADGVRSMCLDGNIKYIRKTKPENTVANTIIPKFRYMVNAINSSYSAGYCNWFYQPDYSVNGNSYLWIPPSIKAMGVYIYCNTYFHPWSAPAGQTRGIINDAIDIAFIPLDADAGQIYSNQWNYAMSYPVDGIVIEGHKTFQSQKTALDRVNVRRLMLDLERKISRIARQFVYEGNTAYTRQLFVDTTRTVLEDAVAGNGIQDYAIKCDEDLNTTNVIENNEMRCKIAVRPVKTVDYIVIDLIATRQSANVNEEVLR